MDLKNPEDLDRTGSGFLRKFGLIYVLLSLDIHNVTYPYNCRCPNILDCADPDNRIVWILFHMSIPITFMSWDNQQII